MVFRQMSQVFDKTTAKFFKTHEGLLSGNLEFVRYDPEVFEEIENEFRQLTKIDYKTRKDFDIFIINLRTVMSKRPEMFQPYSYTKHNKMLFTVRMFEDGNQKFVMKAEFFEAINKASPDCDLIEYEYEDWHFNTIEMNEVFRSFRDRIHNIEFICTPILRAKHRAVPIKGPYSEFYVLGVDALFHFLRNIIVAVKMFQKTPEGYDWKQRQFFFSNLEMVFNPKVEHIQFFKWNAFSIVVERFYESMKFFEILPANDVRDVKRDGFTVDDLKNELEYLGLTLTIPEITDHAEVVYEEVNRVKKEEYLRTCDMFDAIEHCQLICIFNRIPNLRKFLHNQKSCGRVLTLKCDSCIPKPPKTSSSENFYSQNSKKCPEHIESMNTSRAECSSETSIPEEKSSKGSDEKSSGFSSANQDSKIFAETPELTDSTKMTSSDTSPNEDSTQDTQIHTENRDHIAITTIVSQKNESQNCDNCFRSSEMLNETQKELKTSQNKVKKQKTQLERKQKEIDDLNQNFATEITSAKSQVAEFKLETSKMLEERTKIVENMEKAHLEFETQLKKENSKLELKLTDAEKQSTEEKRKSKKIVDDQKKELKNLKEGHSKISKENDGLKLKVSKLEDIQAQLKEENSKKDQSFEKSKTDLMERVSRLEKELKSEKQKTEQLKKQVKESQEKSARIQMNEEQKWIAEKREFEQKIFQKTRQINEFLHASKTRMMAEYEESRDMIQQLQTNLSSTYIANPMALKSYPYNQNIPHNYFTPLNPHQSPLDSSKGFVRPRYVPACGTLLNNHAPSTSSVNSVVNQEMGEMPIIYYHQNSSQSPLPNPAYEKPIVDNRSHPSPCASPSMKILEKFVEEQTTIVNDPTIYYYQPSPQPHFIHPTASKRSSQVPSSSNVGNRAHSKPSIEIQEEQETSDHTTQINSATDKSLQTSSGSIAGNRTSSTSSVKESHSSSAKITENQKKKDLKTSKNTELADSECLICFIDMKSNDKTIKCHQCRRRYHSDCASKWLKVKSECPACRGRLLDPYEFPSLS